MELCMGVYEGKREQIAVIKMESTSQSLSTCEKRPADGSAVNGKKKKEEIEASNTKSAVLSPTGSNSETSSDMRSLWPKLTSALPEPPVNYNTDNEKSNIRKLQKTYCICKRMNSDDEEPMAKCDGTPCTCLKWYHQSCLSIPRQVFEKKWTWVSDECLPPVAHWGGRFKDTKLDNTCTIDNGLTLIYLHILQNPNFYDLVPQGNLKVAIDCFLTKRFTEGKVHWMKSVTAKTSGGVTNCFGNEQEMLFDHLQATWTSTALSVCDNGCNVPTQPETISGFNLRPDSDGNVQEMFTNGQVDACCRKRKHNGRQCQARRKLTDITLPVSCFMVPIRISRQNVTAIDLDLEISVHGSKFYLAGMTMFCEATKHYTAAVRWKGRWMHYDAMRRAKLIPLDQFDGLADPATALYLLR